MPLPMLNTGSTKSIASTISTTRLVIRSDSFWPTLFGQWDRIDAQFHQCKKPEMHCSICHSKYETCDKLVTKAGHGKHSVHAPVFSPAYDTLDCSARPEPRWLQKSGKDARTHSLCSSIYLPAQVQLEGAAISAVLQCE